MRLRRVVLVGWALFVFGGPFLRQVVELEIPVLRRWRMYSGYASNQCVGQYYARIDGELQPVDRLKVVRGVESGWDLPIHERRLERRYVEWTGREICRKGKFRDVRADVKCSSWERWEVVQSGDVNLCRTRP